MRLRFRRRRPVRINPEAHAYIRELMDAPAGTIERIVGDTAGLVGDEYLLETMRRAMRIHRYRTPVHTIARRIVRLAVRP